MLQRIWKTFQGTRVGRSIFRVGLPASNLERAQAAHAAKRPFGEKIPSQNSPDFQDNTLVKRPGEASWHAVSTEEARQIMAEWREWRGPAGQRPIISVPSIH